MKNLFLLLVFASIGQLANAQTHAEKELMRFAIDKGNIWYNEKVSMYDINNLREAFVRDTLFDWKHTAWYEKYPLPDSLVFILTAKERVYINKQIDRMKGFTFNKNLFKNSLAVDFGAMRAYKKTHNGQLSFNRDDYKNGGYAFTKPILIRHNTVGFMFITHDGGSNVMMYVKEQNKWRVKYMLTYAVID